MSPAMSNAKRRSPSSNAEKLVAREAAIPSSETWLFRNRKALALVRRGLTEAAEGKAKVIGSFAAFADDGDS
jgi:hypothetical protein